MIIPAGRNSGLMTSPGLSANCTTVPSTPARTVVLLRTTCAWSSVASAVAYTDNHDLYQNKDLSTPAYLFLHAVDTMAVLKAGLLRISAALLPVQSLVLKGH